MLNKTYLVGSMSDPEFGVNFGEIPLEFAGDNDLGSDFILLTKASSCFAANLALTRSATGAFVSSSRTSSGWCEADTPEASDSND